MKRCPLCAVNLTRTQYEGFPLFQCPQCGGHFVEKPRLEGMKRKKERSIEMLKQDARDSYTGSNDADVKCPRCLRSMKKELILDPITIELDVCADCGAVWLDPGELAMVQLAYETTDKSLSVDMMKQRFDEFQKSGDRQARYHENVGKLKKGNETLSGSFGEGVISGIMQVVSSFLHRRRYW